MTENEKAYQDTFLKEAQPATEVMSPLNNKTQLGELGRLAAQAMSAQRGGVLSKDQVLAQVNEKPLLPSLLSTLLWTLALFILTLFFHVCVGHGPQPWVALPFQIYWSYWLFTLNYASAQRYQCAKPLSDAELIIVSLLSFILSPLTTISNFNLLVDPIFYLWLIALAYIPIRLVKFLDKKEKKEEKKVLMGAMSACAASIPLFIAASWLLWPNSAPIGILWFSWFLSQSFWMAGTVNTITDGTPRQIIASAKKKVYAGTDIVIRYRAFPELERWIIQKAGAEYMNKTLRVLTMWLFIPALAVAIVMGLYNFYASWLLPNAISVIPPNAEAAHAAAAAAASNVSFINNFVLAVFALLTGSTAFILSKPTHLALGEKGMRLLWRSPFFKKDGKYISWSKVNNIYMEHSGSEVSPDKDKLCLHGEGKELTKIRLNAIDNYEEKELLLSAMRTWAPAASKDSRVIESLQPPSDYSYTELWLQALSAPPKRERFKPLVGGAFLKNARYHVLGSLGTGGQGFAYLALDNSNQSQIVLKEFILPVYVEIGVRKSALEQFENEARILRQLQHPQIVHLLDFFVEDHRAYLVLEHIEGASLRAIVENKGALNETETMALAKQMCNILSYLHAQTPPVVHRDFTPDNLILGTDGTLKLIDFNVAQSVESTGGTTVTGTVVGKPSYLPPEQFRGMPTKQSDIYAMGATLYFLLTGKDPSPISVSHPHEINEKISQAADNLVAQATAIDLNTRYSDIAALQKDLETYY